MEIVTLKNGTEHDASLVASIRYALEKLLETHPIAFIDLVMMCRTPGYEPFGTNGKPLADAGLVRAVGGGAQTSGEWIVHEAVREVVLCSVEGEGLNMRVVSPIRQEAKS